MLRPVFRQRPGPRRLVGLVTSAKTEKTVVVTVQRLWRHPIFEKLLVRSSKVMAHDEGSVAKEGDRVRIEQCRPMSKRKAFKLIDVIKSVDGRTIDLVPDIPTLVRDEEKKERRMDRQRIRKERKRRKREWKIAMKKEDEMYKQNELI